MLGQGTRKLQYSNFSMSCQRAEQTFLHRINAETHNITIYSGFTFTCLKMDNLKKCECKAR